MDAVATAKKERWERPISPSSQSNIFFFISKMDYDSTFTKRGREYHYAVNTYPNAMLEEFLTAVKMISLQQDDILLNIPSACIPIENYFTVQPKEYHQYETNGPFAELVGHSKCSWTKIPLQDSYCSKIISLASLHHSTNDERIEIYRECWRLLQPGGSLIIGDVSKGSAQDRWLNEFVNQSNSNGHNGQFWSEEDLPLFYKQGFQVRIERCSYPWRFTSQYEMIDFCKHLFGLDKVTDDEILKGLQTYLGATETGFTWNLLYFIATKPQTFSLNHSKIPDSLPQV